MNSPTGSEPSLQDLDERLRVCERLLLSLHAQMTPQWLRTGGWVSVVAAAIGTLLKAFAEH